MCNPGFFFPHRLFPHLFTPQQTNKQTREMPLKEFQERYPEDFKTGALHEIRQRYAAMAEAVTQQHTHTHAPRTTGVGGMKKRSAIAEPATALRTVKTRRTASVIVPTDHHHHHQQQQKVFNGLPLQTPLPFAGATATAMPITMLTQKRGGRTKASAAAAAVPEAAVVTTNDGKTWALDQQGVGGIPESHRAEVTDMLMRQFEFLVAALGKTVFGGRGRR